MTQMRLPHRSPHAAAHERVAAASPSPPISEAEFRFYIQAKPENKTYRVCKRAMDLAIATTGLIAMSPLLALVACAVKLDSPGPVLFKQTRVGKNGRTFGCYKFRSMRMDAEKLKEQLLHLNERNGPVFKMKNDPRITRLGRYLRKYSVDEFPQLINVIKGEMSLVGPRPPVPSEVAVYQPHHFRRLEVTPGLTGLWQVNGRDASDFEQWVSWDVQYVDSQCLLLDLKILCRTPLAVISGKGAC